MDQSTFNHGKSGDTNPKGRSRSPLLELYTRSLRNEREENINHRTSAACGGRLRLCYTLDEGKESERETTNCPPKRVRSIVRIFKVLRQWNGADLVVLMDEKILGGSIPTVLPFYNEIDRVQFSILNFADYGKVGGHKDSLNLD